MYGLDRFSVFVDKRPLNFNLIEPATPGNETSKSPENIKQAKFKKRANILSSISSIGKMTKTSESTEDVAIVDANLISNSKLKLNENNL